MHPLEQPEDCAAECLADLMDSWRTFGPQPALVSPGRTALSYEGLLNQVDGVGAFLNEHGIGRNDRVAAVLPNSPEAALAFLGVAAVASFAPLNPAYQESEFDFHLQDISPKALLVLAGMDSPVRAIATSRHIPLIELAPREGAEAGLFHLSTAELEAGSARRGGRAGKEDTALILHTSGTTSRPKLVPLLQRHVLASARHTRAALQLTNEDRCLNFMPLFHLSGLITAVLGTLRAGGSLVCVPGFTQTGFFAWLEAYLPTWYTAVPTIHQSIADYAEKHPALARSTSLRQIRSSAATLPPTLLSRLERLFQVPVIESYGMTETHLIASSPRPPLARKPGSVGLPAGPEVAIMGEAGGLLAQGGTGEIVLRGPNVFSGYEDQPEANAAAFLDGWFRTGDLGCFDEEGYLFISGRVKDLINRGGQKVSPWEVEAVLLSHPGVREAVAFPMPHASLGEAVCAAVVLQPGRLVREAALRRYLAERLAPYKIPLRILRVEEISKGTTGKVQRNTLAQRLEGLLDAGQEPEPDRGLEEATPEEWGEAEALEAVLLRHSAVLRCAVLPKHDSLGHLHLAAFLVLGKDTAQEDLMLFLMKEGPACIVPSAFIPLAAMTRDAEGRIDHARLAAIPLSLDQVQRPREIVVQLLATIWEDVLEAGPAVLTDDFFLRGGDSLKSVELLMRIERELGVSVPPEAFFQSPTLGALVRTVQDRGSAAMDSPLVAVQAGTSGTPFFFVHGDFNGGGFHCLRLARALGKERSFYTFHPHGLPGQPPPTTIEAMADRYLPLLLAVRPAGPYHLGGHCNGALVAFEMATRLRAAGETVELLALVSPPHASGIGCSDGEEPPVPPGVEILKQATMLRRAILRDLYAHAIRAYAPTAYPGAVHLLATADDLQKGGLDMGWGALAARVEVREVPGDHLSIFSDHLEDLAACLAPLLSGNPRALSS